MRGWDIQVWQLLLAKGFLYVLLFAFARLFLSPEQRPTRWRPAIAAFTRLMLGLVLGLPLGMLIYRFGPEISIPVFTAFRLALWMSVTHWAYPRLGGTANGLFSLAATGLNTAIDFGLGHWATEGYGLC